ncbi:MAG TPA: DUF885 domain-containing protein [Candidatus Dormibacteraeota bacterium]|nr:DUF885 domain-containing protein [Candidatus Dormibacteraeota bacterium]
MNQEFRRLVGLFLKREYEDSPVRASALGLTQYDEQLDDVSADAFERRRIEDRDWLQRFRAVRDADLEPDERIDRDFVISILRGREITDPLQMWRRQPATYLNPGLSGVFTLFLHRLRPEPELVNAARSRLEKVPDSIAAGVGNLDWSLAPRVYVDRAIGQARAAVRYARELLPAEVRDPALREKLAASGATAAKAFEQFAAFLESNQTRASGSYAIGEEMYTAILKEKELLPYDARELRERGQQQWDELDREMRALAKEIDGSEDWAALLERLNKLHAPTPEGMREEYATWTERARQYLRRSGLVTLPPGEECAVEPSPPFQRPILAVASYNAPPQFSPGMQGHFFVPYPPDGTGAEEVQQRLEGNSRHGVPTTAVHEAYPGHHWHATMMKWRAPSPVRKVYWTAYFGEGWALYAERVMREQGFFEDPRDLLYQYEATIFRAARIVVDTSLHMGEMSFDDAVRFMMQKGNQTEPNARAEVGRYCSWPTQASAYLTGMLEIVDIRERYLRRLGRRDVNALRQFHDAITSSGSMPTALAERAIGGAAAVAAGA